MIASTPSIALGTTALISGLISALLWRRRRLPGGVALALLMMAVTQWALVAALEAASVSLEAKVFWSKLEYLGSGCAVTLYVFFALQRAGSKARLASRRTLALWLLPLANLTVTFTNDWHGWLWVGFEPSHVGANQIIYIHGPAFYAMVAGIYLYALFASILLIRTAVRGGLIGKRQSAAVLIAGLTPLIGGMLYVFHPAWLGGWNLPPMSFGISGVVFAISVIGLRHFDIAPVARDVLFEAMDDGVLVLNESGLIADINPAACRLLETDTSSLGKPADRVLSRWPKLLQYCLQGNTEHFEVYLSETPLRVIEARLTPISEGEKALTGVLVVLRAITARVHNQRRLQEAHDQLQAQVVEIGRLQKSVRQQAIHDALTGLFNRRYLEETLPREVSASKRRGAPMAIILLDVDHFKAINDTFGHQEGDRTLQRLAMMLDDNTREGDIACRYGGDEFVLVLPDTSLADALDKAEALRQACTACAQGKLMDVTISLGVACAPDHGDDGGRVLLVADRALYRAKESGRNRVYAGERDPV